MCATRYSGAMLLAIVALLVFAAAAAGDYVESYFVRRVADGDARGAARMSVAMYSVSLIGFFAVIKVSTWLVIPEILGVYIGTRLAVGRQVAATMARALHEQETTAIHNPCHFGTTEERSDHRDTPRTGAHASMPI
jgi:hypothetical protein